MDFALFFLKRDCFDSGVTHSMCDRQWTKQKQFYSRPDSICASQSHPDWTHILYPIPIAINKEQNDFRMRWNRGENARKKKIEMLRDAQQNSIFFHVRTWKAHRINVSCYSCCERCLLSVYDTSFLMNKHTAIWSYIHLDSHTETKPSFHLSLLVRKFDLSYLKYIDEMECHACHVAVTVLSRLNVN